MIGALVRIKKGETPRQAVIRGAAEFYERTSVKPTSFIVSAADSLNVQQECAVIEMVEIEVEAGEMSQVALVMLGTWCQKGHALVGITGDYQDV